METYTGDLAKEIFPNAILKNILGEKFEMLPLM
jgi:hypothetical protein